MPVWVANFILMGYGTGAVMGVPGHDQRDWEFAKKYGLAVKPVITPADGSELNLADGAYVEKGRLVNSGEFDGLAFEQAFGAIAGKLEENGMGECKDQLPAAGLGHCPAALLGLPHSHDYR